MGPLYYTGRARDAANQLLINTPLGTTLADHYEDDGTLLTVHSNAHERYDIMSTGERHLFKLLTSLGGHGHVNLYALVSSVDDDCAFWSFWSLGILAGKADTIAPVGSDWRAS